MVGVSTIFYGYGGMPIDKKVERIIDAFRRASVEPFVQIGASRPGGRYEDVVRELLRLAKEHDVRYSIHQSIWLPSDDFFLNLASSNIEIRKASVESLKKSIDFAKSIGAGDVSFHAGYGAEKVSQEEEFEPLNPSGDTPYESAYSNSISSIYELIDYAGNDVHLGIENFNHRPERRYLFSLVENFSLLPKKIGVILNTGHLFYTGRRIGDSSYTRVMIEALRGRVREMHLNDNDGTEDQHMLVGYGKVPVEEMVGLVSSGRSVPRLIIECHKSRHNYPDQELVANIRLVSAMRDRISRRS